jgi:AraC-like DNA-binding protein
MRNENKNTGGERRDRHAESHLGIPDALANGAGRDKQVNFRVPISVISHSLGYESEAAFSTAFKRVMGCSPRPYSRGRNPASPSLDDGEAAHAEYLETIAG